MDMPASPRPSDTFLSEFGTPTLLWRVLQSVGYTEPPEYSWWEVDMTGPIYKQHLELGFDLTKFHEFCCLSVSAGGYQEIRKKGPHVGIT